MFAFKVWGLGAFGRTGISSAFELVKYVRAPGCPLIIYADDGFWEFRAVVFDLNILLDPLVRQRLCTMFHQSSS